MATIREKKLVRNSIKNLKADEPLNTKELLVSSGYAEITAERNAAAVFEQKGVKEEFAKLGFDEATAKEVVGQILISKEEEARDRLKAAEMVFKVHGSYAPEKHANLNLNITKEVGDIDLDLLVQEAENKLKEQKLNG